MKNFFIAGSNVRELSKKILKYIKSSGEAYQFFIQETDGWVVNEQLLDDIRSRFDLVVRDESRTTYEGIYSVRLVEKGKDSRIRFLDWDGRLNKSSVEELIQDILSPVLGGKDILISVPHKSTRPPGPKSSFNIFIWSSPDGSATEEPPEEIWGIPVDCRDPAFSPSGQGVPILDDEGYVVAELVETTLYIHHDLVHTGKDSELELFQRLLEELVVELSMTPQERKARKEEMKKNAQNATRRKYISACKNRANTDFADAEIELREINQKIDRAQGNMVSNIRHLEHHRKRFEFFKKIDEELNQTYNNEYESLLAIEKVLYIKVSSSKILIFTDTLFCEHPKTKNLHEIGKFRIEVPLDGAGGVKWFNMDRQIRKNGKVFHAPSVGADAKAYTGNTEEVFPELIAYCEFAQLAGIAINFIEDINDDEDSLDLLNRWPVIKKKK